MKVLVTGATGFVGRHLIDSLIKNSHAVTALVRQTSSYQQLKEKGVSLIFGSLENLHEQKINWPEFDSVIHVGGLIKSRNSQNFYLVNTNGTFELARQFQNQNLKSFIFVSSVSARGPKNLSENGDYPVSHYGKSKKMAEEKLIQLHLNFPLIILRPPIVYGPYDEETLKLFQFFKMGFFPMAMPKNQKMSFVYVEDLVNCILHILNSNQPKSGIYYPEDGNEGYLWNEVLELAKFVYKKKIYSIPIPFWFSWIISMASEIIGRIFNKNPMLTREKFKEIIQHDWSCSSKSLTETFNFKPQTKLDEGLIKAQNFYKKAGWL